MKNFVISFLKRGALFASLGPVILAVVYIFLHASGVVENLPVTKMITEILTSTLMAFIAAGISAVYTVDRIHPALAGMIQGTVLFFDYIIIYLVNGWLPFAWQAIALFIVIYFAVFAAIWLIVYFSVRNKIAKLNEQIK